MSPAFLDSDSIGRHGVILQDHDSPDLLISIYLCFGNNEFRQKSPMLKDSFNKCKRLPLSTS